MLKINDIERLLGSQKAKNLLEFSKPKVSKNQLHIPGPDWVERIFKISDRNPKTLQSLQKIFNHGRLQNTGYLSILPVDQGIEPHLGGDGNVAAHVPQGSV